MYLKTVLNSKLVLLFPVFLIFIGCSEKMYIERKKVKSFNINPALAKKSPLDFARSINPNISKEEDYYFIGYMYPNRGYVQTFEEDFVNLFREYCKLNNGIFISIDKYNRCGIRPYGKNKFAYYKSYILENIVDNIIKDINYKFIQEEVLKDYSLPDVYIKDNFENLLSKNYPKNFILSAIMNELCKSLENYSRRARHKLRLRKHNTNHHVYSCLDRENSFFLINKITNYNTFSTIESYLDFDSKYAQQTLNRCKNSLNLSKDDVIKLLKKDLKKKIDSNLKYIVAVGVPENCKNFIDYVTIRKKDGETNYVLIKFKNRTNKALSIKLFNNLIFEKDNKEYSVLYGIDQTTRKIIASTSKGLIITFDNELVLNPSSVGILELNLKIPSVSADEIQGGSLIINNCKIRF